MNRWQKSHGDWRRFDLRTQKKFIAAFGAKTDELIATTLRQKCIRPRFRRARGCVRSSLQVEPYADRFQRKNSAPAISTNGWTISLRWVDSNAKRGNLPGGKNCRRRRTCLATAGRRRKESPISNQSLVTSAPTFSKRRLLVFTLARNPL